MCETNNASPLPPEVMMNGPAHLEEPIADPEKRLMSDVDLASVATASEQQLCNEMIMQSVKPKVVGLTVGRPARVSDVSKRRLTTHARPFYMRAAVILAVVNASSTAAQCTSTCGDASDGYCDDGGPGSQFSICGLGTDCADCGTRYGTYASPPPPPRVSSCASDCRALYSSCSGLGGDWDGSGCGWGCNFLCEPQSVSQCISSCNSRSENGLYGSSNNRERVGCRAVCGLGPVPSPPTTSSTAVCTNTCTSTFLGQEYSVVGDGICDDGGPGAELRLCSYGADCDDCGPREARPPGPRPPPGPDYCGLVTEQQRNRSDFEHLYSDAVPGSQGLVTGWIVLAFVAAFGGIL